MTRDESGVRQEKGAPPCHPPPRTKPSGARSMPPPSFRLDTEGQDRRVRVSLVKTTVPVCSERNLRRRERAVGSLSCTRRLKEDDKRHLAEGMAPREREQKFSSNKKATSHANNEKPARRAKKSYKRPRGPSALRIYLRFKREKDKSEGAES